MFLPCQGQNHACVVSRRMWQYVRSLPCTDFKLGPFPPETNSRGGFYDVRNVSSANGCGDFQEINFSRGGGFQEFGGRNAANQPRHLDRTAIQGFDLLRFAPFPRKRTRHEYANAPGYG